MKIVEQRKVACDILVDLDLAATRQAGHGIYAAASGTAKDHATIAGAFRTQRWLPIPNLGIYPLWVLAHNAKNPLEVAEYRFGIMVLHTFRTTATRDVFLNDLPTDLLKFIPVQTGPQRENAAVATYSPHSFTIGVPQ